MIKFSFQGVGIESSCIDDDLTYLTLSVTLHGIACLYMYFIF